MQSEKVNKGYKSVENVLYRVDIDKLAKQMQNPEEAHTDYDKIAVKVCTEFCLNHCPEKYKVNAGVAKIEIFCQDIYDVLIRWKVVNADDISLDKILDNFTCKYNAERLTSK